MITDNTIYLHVEQEEYRQLNKWGEQTHSPDKWLVFIIEELGETAQAVTDGNLMQAADEAIQVIALTKHLIKELHRQVNR